MLVIQTLTDFMENSVEQWHGSTGLPGGRATICLPPHLPITRNNPFFSYQFFESEWATGM